MKKSRRIAGLAAAIITFAGLTVFAGPRYHIGWKDGGNHYHCGGYRNNRQHATYPQPDSVYPQPHYYK